MVRSSDPRSEAPPRPSGPAARIAGLRERVERELLLPLAPSVCDIPGRLREAMEYSLRAGGKRVRPVLLLCAGAAVGGDEEAMLPFACAVEYVHTYSLIHDDLPAMDDDEFRRGKPSCHRAFGEAEAILAGDALLTEAFRVMGEAPLARREPARALRAAGILARAAGASGMAGGQMIDLRPDSSPVEEIHRRKTAALLEACAAMGAVLGGAPRDPEERLAAFGRSLGLLFQITDDLLDETGRFEETGKAVSKDRARGKRTWPGEHGTAAARARAEELREEAVAALAGFGAEADPLRELAMRVAARRS